MSDISPLSEIFDPNSIELQESESLETIEGDLYLNTVDRHNRPIQRKIKFFPKKGRCNSPTRVGPCHSWPAKGKKHCRFHGGSLPQAAKVMKTGQYVDNVPHRFQDLYNDSQALDNMDNIIDDIPLLNALIAYYLEQAEHGQDIADVWLKLKGHLWDLKNAISQEDSGLIASVIDDLDNLLDPLNRAALAEDRMLKLISQKADLITKHGRVKYTVASTELKEAQTGILYDFRMVSALINTLFGELNNILLNQEILEETRQAVFEQIMVYAQSEDFNNYIEALPITIDHE